MFLLETVYEVPELKKVDAHFKFLMDHYKSPLNFEDNPEFKIRMNEIARIMSKIFNIDCKLFYDNTNKGHITFGMAIWPSYEEFKRKALDAVKTKKGFKMKECNNVSVEIDSAFFDSCVKSPIMNEKHMTAVLLHEFGHKLFTNAQDKEYEKMLIKRLPGPADIAIKVAMVLLTLGIVTIPLAILILYKYCAKLAILNDIDQYSRAEGLSDDTAVYYGYGKEKYEVLKFLGDEMNYKVKKSRFELLNWLRVKENYIYLRKKNVIKIIEKEANNPENSSAIRNEYKKALKDIYKTQEQDYDGINYESLSYLI